MKHSESILQSWKANAGNWIATIDNNEIESRRLVTNDAIVNAILSYSPQSLLDIGCGEGWLSRRMRDKGIDVLGVDAVEELISDAIKKGGACYRVANFRQLASEEANINNRFDAAVINFSLIDKDDSEVCIKSVSKYLNDDGYLFIQTLHPLAIAAGDEYTTGWKTGSWNGMKRNFEQPYQWYFRTLEDWVQLFTVARLKLVDVKEPLHPDTKKPVSVIFILNRLF